jgi:hypothetical protein
LEDKTSELRLAPIRIKARMRVNQTESGIDFVLKLARYMR